MDFHDHRMAVFSNEPASRYQQIPVRVDDDLTFTDDIFAAYLNALATGHPGHGLVVFCHTIAEMCQSFRRLVFLWATRHDAVVAVATADEKARLLKAHSISVAAKTGHVPDTIEVPWSGEHHRPPRPRPVLVADAHRAWVRLNLGIATTGETPVHPTRTW
jgi:hypothetical protein